MPLATARLVGILLPSVLSKNGLPDDVLLKMAQQHNQSETAFFVRTDTGFELRWFTTQYEINLCGTPTLASAHVIFEYLDYPHTEIIFSTRFVGDLKVTRSGDWLTLKLPGMGLRGGWKTLQHCCSAPSGLAGRRRCGQGATIWWCWKTSSRSRH
ncbi:Predicted epimerase, PhzC/PhzF homolog [Leclercia adecarboxylata]|uniref:Predicted epimerase, PhzC/PhzF homolog n=1 Tax=Leclercia adecarboxylata TaxID=83655 RepID=A0A4V6YXY8_9ENTR|nr:Predicted epimerase, PhzC/PhzF homolog [Leclercia adecarboxylata]